MNLKELEKEFPKCNIYTYGSFVYKTNDSRSDHDFIIVGDFKESREEKRKFGDLKILTKNDFLKFLNSHETFALECFFLSSELKITPNIFEFSLNKETLKKSLSKRSSNSWVKAKKKLSIEKEIRIAQKSLFHAFRIIDFGIQILKTGSITNFSSSNEILLKLKTLPNSWDSWENEFKQKYNKIRSEFRNI